MKNTPVSAFKFTNFFIQESNFKQNPEEKGEFNVNLAPRGTLFKSEKVFQLDLIVEINDSNDNFKATIHAVGIFDFKEVLTKEDLNNYFYVNAPAIIFPYVRAHVATLSALSGSGHLITLPPMNLASLKDDLAQNTVVLD
jgi:preprotein translocase subunit SecB